MKSEIKTELTYTKDEFNKKMNIKGRLITAYVHMNGDVSITLRKE